MVRISSHVENSAPVYAIATLVSLLCWSVFIIHHPMHDHQLSMVATLREGADYGRPLFDIFSALTANADILIFNYIISIIFQIFAGGLIARRLQLSRIATLVLIIVFATHPFFLGLFYYSNATAMFTLAIVLCIAAAVCLQPGMRIFASTVLLVAGLLTYQPSIGVFPVMVAVIGLAALLNSTHNQLYIIKFYASGILAIVIAGLIYLITINYFNFTGSHATAMSPVIPLERIFRVTIASFQHLFVSQPDFPIQLRILQIIVLFLSVVAILWRVSPRKWPLALLTVVTAVIATKSGFLIALRGDGDLIFQYRYNIGVAVLIAGFLALGVSALQGSRINSTIIRTLHYTSITTLCFLFIQQNLIRQSVLYYGQLHDLSIMNRIIDRIETNPAFKPEVEYQLVRTGPLSQFRIEKLNEQNGPWNVMADEHMDFGSIGNLWVPESSTALLGSKVRFKENTIEGWRSRVLFWRRYVVENEVPYWPSDGSVFIDGTTIVVNTRFPGSM